MNKTCTKAGHKSKIVACSTFRSKLLPAIVQEQGCNIAVRVSDLLKTSECLAKKLTHTHIRALSFLFICVFVFISVLVLVKLYARASASPSSIGLFIRVKVRILVSSHIGGCHQSIKREYDSHYKDSHYGMDDHFQVWMFEVPLPEWLNTGSAATSSSNSSVITGYQRMNTSSCCHTVVTGLRSTSLSLPLLAEVNFNKSPGLLRVTLLMRRRPALSIGVSKIGSIWQDLTRI